MVRYTDRNKTPLAYHTFFRFVALPLGILVTLGNIFEELGYFKEFQLHPGDLLYALTVIDLIFFLTDLALLVVCVVGLFRWAAYGWYDPSSPHCRLPTIYSHHFLPLRRP